MKTIESFRNNDYFRFALLVGTNPPKAIDLNHCAFITNAYHTTLADLDILENSQRHLHNGRTCHSSIITWNLGIQSFLDNILQVATIFSGTAPQAGPLIKDKIEEATKLLQLHNSLNAIETLYQKSDDLEAINNAIMQGSKAEGYIIKSTLFSSNPKYISLVDSIQAMLIAYQVFELFRDTITGWDLMPVVDIDINGERRVEKLDVLLKKIILPATKDILAKFHLTTGFDFREEFQSLPPSPIIKKDYLYPIQKIQEDLTYEISQNPGKTQIIKHFQFLYTKKFENL